MIQIKEIEYNPLLVDGISGINEWLKKWVKENENYKIIDIKIKHTSRVKRNVYIIYEEK